MTTFVVRAECNDGSLRWSCEGHERAVTAIYGHAIELPVDIYYVAQRLVEYMNENYDVVYKPWRVVARLDKAEKTKQKPTT